MLINHLTIIISTSIDDVYTCSFEDLSRDAMVVDQLDQARDQYPDIFELEDEVTFLAALVHKTLTTYRELKCINPAEEVYTGVWFRMSEKISTDNGSKTKPHLTVIKGGKDD
jgi:hypothetical protein